MTLLQISEPERAFAQTRERPLVLSLETATRAGSIAVTRGSRLLAASTGDGAVSHSINLLSDLEETLAAARVTLAEIELFAVALGPGSFTGLRIGLATVKSFAATLGRRCVGIPTLHAVAHAAGPSARTIAMLPAGRGEVYAQLLSVAPSGEVVPLGDAENLSPHSLLESLRGLRGLTWAGEGAHAHVEAITSLAAAEGLTLMPEGSETGTAQGQLKREGWVLAAQTEALAVNVAYLALLRAGAGETTDPADLQALYVRPSDAEINLDAQNKNRTGR